MQLPDIHLNGTDPRDLLGQYSDAMVKLAAAIRALEAIECHGRDYYRLGPSAASIAYQEKLERILKLTSVREDIVAIAEHINKHIT